ncbi:MAG: DNA polymerase III subunit delta' [Bacteroidota bacterium]|nr:DNA polymerase III subunit delta' [Bacteroidota bacterium]
MRFQDVLGQEYLKKHLITTADNKRIPHAQLFVGKAGSGTLAMALAYARYVLCGTDNVACNMKVDAYSHPDLHFVFPTIAGKEDFQDLFREFLKETPYGTLFDWYKKIGELGKQGEIRVGVVQNIIKSTYLKSYEGGYRIFIIWEADKMNVATANKLLKIIEEPPKNTLIILTTEDLGAILQTIRSRCQILYLNQLPEQVIAKELNGRFNISEEEAQLIAHQSQGSYTKALELVHQEEDNSFDNWFVEWVRTAFKAKGTPSTIIALMDWSEKLSKEKIEVQKRFLEYCIEVFRQAMLLNYQATSLVYLHPKVQGFELSKFAKFVNSNNIESIYKELSQAIYHIERNGNAKMIFTDLSIKLTRLIHQN